jgi:acetyltransferase-like isoleucine patch superfamily enzyme
MLHLVQRARTWLFTACMQSEFHAWGKRSRLSPGTVLVNPHLVTVGHHVSVGAYSWINAKDDRGDGRPTLRIGDHAYLGRMVQINAWQDVDIGRHVMVGDRVFIGDADHNYQDTTTPIILQGDCFKGPVRLEEGCWIGAGAVILPNVTVGANAIVGANAVVTRDVPARSIVGGVPARLIKRLDNKD